MRTRLAVDGRVLTDRYAGIGRITAEILSRLSDCDDFDVTVFVQRGQESERFSLDALIESQGFERAYFDLPMTSPLQWLRWPKALSRARADIAFFPYHLGAAVTGSARRFSVVHDCIFESDSRFVPDLKTRVAYPLLTRVVARRGSVLTPSKASAAQLEHFYGICVEPWQVVPWGVDASFHTDDRAAVVNGVALPQNYYLHVGARRPHKNVEVIVAALAHLPEDEHLILVGDVDRRFPDPVPGLVETLGLGDRVIELSHVSESDLRGLYAGARALMYPSLTEGFGLPLLEAMAAGLPVIASDIEVFREVAGDAAILVDPAAPLAWALASQTLDDQTVRARMVNAGLERARAANWDAAVADLVTALQRTGH